MAQITKREIFIDTVLSQTLTTPPFDKIVLPPLSIGTHTVYSKVYVDGVLAVTEPTVTFQVEEYVPPVVVPTGIVSNYEFEEASGDLIDSINGYNGTVNGTVTRQVVGASGNCYSFPGLSTAFISIPSQAAHSFVNSEGAELPFTIRMQIQPDDLTADGWIISKRDNTTNAQEWQVMMYEDAVQIWCHRNDFSIAIGRKIPIAELTPGQMNHIVFTYDGSKARVGFQGYVNGNLVTTLNGGNANSYPGMSKTNATVTIGKAAFTGSFNYAGKVDSIVIDRGNEWTAQQVLDDFNTF